MAAFGRLLSVRGSFLGIEVSNSLIMDIEVELSLVASIATPSIPKSLMMVSKWTDTSPHNSKRSGLSKIDRIVAMRPIISRDNFAVSSTHTVTASTGIEDMLKRESVLIDSGILRIFAMSGS